MREVRHALNGTVAAAFILLISISCSQTSNPPPPAGLYEGDAARRTPYDAKFERVRRYMREAREKIKYLEEPPGEDYWQLPEETEELGTGDCEDFAIWLYARMKRDGVDNIRLCIGKFHSSAPLMHAWVLWFRGDRVFILDPSVHYEPICASSLDPDRYIPYYSYDLNDRWIHPPAGSYR